MVNESNREEIWIPTPAELAEHTEREVVAKPGRSARRRPEGGMRISRAAKQESRAARRVDE